MTKLVLLVLSLSLFLLTSCTALTQRPAAHAKQALLHHTGSSTVALVAKADGMHLSYCTGVWISKDVILTAAHCVEAAAEMKSTENDVVSPYHVDVEYITESEVVGLRKEPIRVHEGVSIKVDIDHDLALIATKGEVPLHDIAVLAKDEPPPGTDLYIVGHPKGMYWTYIEGTVSAYRSSVPYDDRDLSYMQVSAPVWMGNSGGGAFTYNGELVGVAESVGVFPLCSFFIDVHTIRKFLADKD